MRGVVGSFSKEVIIRRSSSQFYLQLSCFS